MGLTRLTLPRLGETMEEARVTDWLVAPDQPFARGDVLLEVETDKTVVEVPALLAGVMRAHLVAPGDIVEIGQDIAEVESEAALSITPDPRPDAKAVAKLLAMPVHLGAVAQSDLSARSPASPRARRLAQARNLDIAAIAGTGLRGRVTVADVEAAKVRRLRYGAIAYDRHGTDTGAGTVLLLHGLFATAASFGDLPARLSQKGAHVLVPDLPGHGDSAAVHGLAAIEASLLAFLIDLAPTGPVRLVGHSMGAILATRLAQRFGDRLNRLVLLSPAGLSPRINQDFLDILLEAQTVAALRHGMGLLGTGPISDAVLAQELVRLGPQRGAQRLLARALACGGVQQIDIAPDIASLSAPISALFGTSDQILDWQACARLPMRAAIHLREGAGHMPHLSADSLVQDMIFA